MNHSVILYKPVILFLIYCFLLVSSIDFLVYSTLSAFAEFPKSKLNSDVISLISSIPNLFTGFITKNANMLMIINSA